MELVILRADLRFRKSQHLHGIFWIGEPLKPAFTQGIEGYDGYATTPDLIELMQHSRAIDTDILSEEEHAIGLVEVLDLHCSDRNANRFR